MGSQNYPRSQAIIFVLQFTLYCAKNKTKTENDLEWSYQVEVFQQWEIFNSLVLRALAPTHQAPTPTFCYLQYTSLYCTLRWHKASGKKWECSKCER